MQPTQPTVAILSFSPVGRDARVLRQIEWLGRSYLVRVVGGEQLAAALAAERHPRWSVRHPGRPDSLRERTKRLLSWGWLLLGRVCPAWVYPCWYWSQRAHQVAWRLVRETKPGLIHANDWQTLPLATRVAAETGAQIVLDLHEFAPLEWENHRNWMVLYRPMIDYFLRHLPPSVAATVTVNEAIAQRYGRDYGFHPTVVMNIPACRALPPFRPTDPARVRLVHHGMPLRDRHLASMIEAVARTDARYTLHFLLIDANPDYVQELKDLAQRVAPARVFFHPPVPPDQIVNRIGEFDVGLYLFPTAGFNNATALPNKFFDFLTAGLAVCIGPSPEMARLTREFDCGQVAESFAPAVVAEVLNRWTPAEIDRMKQNAVAARQTLKVETEMEKLVALYRGLAADPS